MSTGRPADLSRLLGADAVVFDMTEYLHHTCAATGRSRAPRGPLSSWLPPFDLDSLPERPDGFGMLGRIDPARLDHRDAPRSPGWERAPAGCDLTTGFSGLDFVEDGHLPDLQRSEVGVRIAWKYAAGRVIVHFKQGHLQ